jgi:Fe-Mn family superoxide dismutase
MKTTRRQAVQTLFSTATAALAGAAWLERARAEAPVTVTVTPAPAATGPYTLPALPYAYDALEPHIDAATMRLHHDKHHAAYVAKLNEAVAGHPDAIGPIDDVLQRLGSLSADIQTAVRNQGGGHANHSLFWLTLGKGGGKPGDALTQAIASDLGGLEALKAKITKGALGVFGSGWSWVVVDAARKLQVVTTPNQDSPILNGQWPLFGVDVWEHAYYLKYKNKRADYVDAWWNVVNWDFVSQRYAQLTKA